MIDVKNDWQNSANGIPDVTELHAPDDAKSQSQASGSFLGKRINVEHFIMLVACSRFRYKPPIVFRV